MQLGGNTILITGGTSGIGQALAVALHGRGNQVIIAGRRQTLLDQMTAAHPGMRAIAVDLAVPAAVNRFAAAALQQFPTLNVLVNNAGIARPENLRGATIDFSVARSIIDTNIASVLQLTSALLPALTRQPQATILTTTSGLAFVPLAAMPAYSASKAFLHSWLQSLRWQLRETSVEVLELAPPYVQTELGGPAQASDPNAMPLADYIAEVMQILHDGNTTEGEVLVQRVRALRLAERSGDYASVFSGLNSHW